MKGLPFVIRRYTKGVPYHEGWTLGQSLPVQTFIEYPPGSQFDLHIVNQRENLILDQEVLKAILTITTSIN